MFASEEIVLAPRCGTPEFELSHAGVTGTRAQRRESARSPLRRGQPGSAGARRRNCIAAIAIGVFIAGAVAAQATAATVRWTGASGDKKWETVGNWVTLDATGAPQGAPAAAPGGAADGGPHDVIIPGTSGTIYITAAGKKELKSFQLAAGGAATTLTSARDATGKAVDIEISATDGIAIGAGHRVWAGASIAGGGIGRDGGSVTLKATGGAIDIGSDATVAVGNGGGAGAQPAGRGGNVRLQASTLVRATKAHVLGGNSGTGAGAAAMPAVGGTIRILVSNGNLINVGWATAKGIRAGDGRDGGGDVFISANNLYNNGSFARIFAGAATTGLAMPGGQVLIAVLGTVQNTGDTRSGDRQPAVIRGGNGSPARAGANSGVGGRVGIVAQRVLNGISEGDRLRPGEIVGGSAGIGNTPAPVPGGMVIAAASEKIRAGTVTGGQGRTAAAGGAPRGSVLLAAPLILGVEKAVGLAIRLAVGVGLLAAPGMIDLSGLAAGAITADEFVCMNADDGTIKLTNAATDSIVCGGGSGQVVLNAASVMLTGVAVPVPPEQYTTLIDRAVSGALQIGGACSEPTGCDGDFDLDGVVGVFDLELLFMGWSEGDLSFDLDGDGQLDGADLGILLGNWGPCEAS